ncbi:MAG: cation:proton antiporter [bacterium]|nr:cation:proton antiporter [bacterium]
MEIALLATGGGALIFLSYFFSHIFEKFQIPDVLFLVAIGLILGPIGGFIDVSQAGVMGELFVTLTLLIILFEAGLGIKIRKLLKTAPRALLLMSLMLAGSIATVVGVGHYVLGIALTDAVIIGLLLGGVSSGLAVPLVRKLPVSEEACSLLTFEANMSDIVTIAAVFAIIDFSNTGIFNVATFSTSLGARTALAVLVGSIAALLWSQLIAKVRNIQNNVFMTPALVLLVFGISELLGASGVFAAFAFGIVLGNLQLMDARGLPASLGFHEFTLTKWETRMFSGLVFLLKTYFFVYIGLSIGLDNMLALSAGFIATLLLFAVRSLSVKIALANSVPLFDRQVLARLFPKGLMGAALVTLLSDQVARDFTYSVVLFSIILTSALIFFLRPKEGVDRVYD